MAKNVPKATNLNAPAPAPKENVYEGTFKGNLEGNASTATALQNAMRLTLTGDVDGFLYTKGENAQCEVTVLRAITAHEADHATTADSVSNAATADKAAHAEYADHAVSADKAISAESATYAQSAGTAKNASFAAQAESAGTADTAGEATHAESADEAKHAAEADHALTADRLANYDDPVPLAVHAETADHATIADYDCLGRAIEKTYLTKEEGVSKDEAFTEQDANALFARKDEIILQATISGKAWGYGYKQGQTLNLIVESLDLDPDGSPGTYGDLVFLDKTSIPDDPDTTKIYITSDQLMWLYNVDAQKWIDVRSKLSEEAEDQLGKLDNYVDMTSDQTEIHGTKGFWDPIYAPIPSLRDAPDHAVVVVHNIREIYEKLKAEIEAGDNNITIDLKDFEDRLDALEDLVYGVSHVGDYYKAFTDLSISANTKDMLPGAIYVGLLEEDKTFIPFNPDTNQQIDPDQVPYWERHFIKDSNGLVTWKDVPYVHKQTNLSYVYLDHVPTKKESESFEEDTWYYYPAKLTTDGGSYPGGPSSGSGGMGGEFDVMQFLENDNVEDSEADAGEFNLYGCDSLFDDISVPPSEGGAESGATIGGEFKAIQFLENENVEDSEPKDGELNLYGCESLFDGVLVPSVDGGDSSNAIASDEFKSIKFLENDNVDDSEVDEGELNLYGCGNLFDDEP